MMEGDIAGSDHVLALTRGGKVVSWGYGAQGQLGRIPTRQMRHKEADMLKFGPVSFRGIRGRPRSLPILLASAGRRFVQQVVPKNYAYNEACSKQFFAEGEQIPQLVLQHLNGENEKQQ